MSFIARIKSYVLLHRLIQNGDKIIIACSGGADSTALFFAVKALSGEMELKLSIAHVNYGLRGSESENDENFVRYLAEEAQLPINIKKVDPLDLQNKGTSLQMACRKIRYKYFRILLEESGPQKVALGHTHDDAIETFYLRLFTGSGLSGLKGMLPLHNNRFIRPMLSESRRTILKYLGDEKKAYREDSSNKSNVYKRNKIRHILLPFIQENFNPDYSTAMARTLDLLRIDNDYIEEHVDSLIQESEFISWKVDEIVLDRNRFDMLHQSIQQRLLLKLLFKQPDIGQVSLYQKIKEAISAVKEDKAVTLNFGTDLFLKVNKKSIVIGKKSSDKIRSFDERDLVIPGKCVFHSSNICIQAIVESITPAEVIQNHNCPEKVFFDRRGLADTLTVRSRKKGDRFTPFGMTGSISLKKFLINSKIPAGNRPNIPVVLSGKKIIWVAGYRRSSEAPVTKTTGEVVRLQLLPGIN